jgi:hypothetical protein
VFFWFVFDFWFEANPATVAAAVEHYDSVNARKDCLVDNLCFGCGREELAEAERLLGLRDWGVKRRA